MRLCRRISTGEILGAQSPSPADGALLERAAVEFPEYPAEDMEEAEVTAQEYAALMAAQNAPTLAQAQAAATVALREAYEAHLAPYRVEYGNTETLGWPRQLELAQAIAAGTATPEQIAELQAMCDARATVSPRPAEELAPLAQAQRIISNNAAWSAIYFPATGKRNGFQDAINAAQTVEDVPMAWEF